MAIAIRLVESAYQSISPRAAGPAEIRRIVKTQSETDLPETTLRRSIGHLEANHKIRRIAGTKTWVYEASAEAGGAAQRARDPRHRTTHRAGWEMVPRRCIRDVDKSFSRLTLSHGGHQRCVADGQVVLRAPAFPTVIQKVRITPALRRRLAFVGAGRLVHRGAGLLSGCMSATWQLASSRAVVCRGYEAMADRALPALAVAYESAVGCGLRSRVRRERYLYDNNNQREPSGQDIAEFQPTTRCSGWSCWSMTYTSRA